MVYPKLLFNLKKILDKGQSQLSEKFHFVKKMKNSHRIHEEGCAKFQSSMLNNVARTKKSKIDNQKKIFRVRGD